MQKMTEWLSTKLGWRMGNEEPVTFFPAQISDKGMDPGILI